MRTAETNPIYQSKILPIIQKAETEIKTLILVAFLYAQPKTMLLGSILAVINRVKKELPIEFKDRDQYVKGLVASADRMVIEGYNKPQVAYNLARQTLKATSPSPINITTPKRYDNRDVTKQREIEGKIREMERKIRLLKTNERMYNVSGDKVTAATYKRVWQKLEAHYKVFCERNGYAWAEYRIKI